jgi:hyperosmotically inducible protein
MKLISRGSEVLALTGVLALAPVRFWHGSLPAPNTPQVAPDNSKNNQDRSSPTADQQKMNASDRAITQNIRKSIMADKNLSTYAHNIKIITQNGKVSLRGPVRSEQEKSNVESKAAAVAGEQNVSSQIEVAPPQ